MQLLKRILKFSGLPALLLVAALFSDTYIYGQNKDSVFLYNGQVLIGNVTGGRLGEIIIDDRDLKILEVKAYKIKALNTVQHFRIETNSKNNYIGIIKRSSKPGWVEILLDDGTVIPVEITNLSIVIPLEKKFFDRIRGNISAGFSYTKSTAIGQLNASSQIEYATPLLEYLLSISMNGSIDSTGYSRDREEIGLFITYSIGPSWFVATSLNYQRNLELSIARRYQELIGGGNKVFVKKKWQMLALSGVTFNQEKSTSGTSSGLLMEIPFIIQFNFFSYRDPNLQINSTQSAFLSLSQKGRFRYSGNINFSWELFRDFRLNFNPYTNSDNQPPEGNVNFDYGITISLAFKF